MPTLPTPRISYRGIVTPPCTRATLIMRHPKDGTYMHVPALCDRWQCDYCARRKTHLWIRAIPNARPTHTVEFTLRQTGARVPQAQYYIYKIGIPAAIRALRRRFGPLEYLYILELHRKGGLHAHVLTRGPDIPHQALREAALRAHLGPVTWIQRVRNSQRAVRYAAKHLCKAQASRELMQWAHRRIHRSRRFLPKPIAEYRKDLAAGYRLVEVVSAPPSSVRPWGAPRSKATFALTCQPHDPQAPLIPVEIVD